MKMPFPDGFVDYWFEKIEEDGKYIWQVWEQYKDKREPKELLCICFDEDNAEFVVGVFDWAQYNI
jgi:hypothetical protein